MFNPALAAAFVGISGLRLLATLLDGTNAGRQIRESFETSLANSASWINKSDGYYVQQRVRVLGG